MTEAVQAVEDTHCGWLYYVPWFTLCNLKAAPMNMQHSLIWILMLYEFDLGCNSAEVTKRICDAKGEGAIDLSTVTRWFKKFHSDCKNFDNQTRSGMLTSLDSKDVL